MIKALRKCLFLVSTVTLLLISVTGFSSAGEIDDITSAIKEKKALWTAGETSMTKLSPEERKKRLGTFKSSLTAASIQNQSNSAVTLTSPTGAFDWRNNNGTNFVTSVKDQGSCGSCWAFATTAALESYTVIHGSSISINDAEQILISCSGAGSCSGGYIDMASSFIRNTGLPVETCFPYTETNNSCANACFNWKNSTAKISNWHWVPQNVTSIKDALFTFGPIVTTFHVYTDFFSYSSGIYSFTKGVNEGNHAVTIVGYSDDSTVPGGGYFIVKNSWGVGWGENGYFRIAYSQLSTVVGFGYQNIAYDGPTPPPGTYSLAVNETGIGKGTVTSSPSGISCRTSCSSSFTSGTQVTLTASPDSGSFFKGWSGACSGKGNCIVNMDMNVSVTATFGTAPVITTATLPNATGGTAYTATLAATSGQTPYTWTLASGSLPPGMTFSATGVISGMPTTAGTYTFSISVTDSQTPAASATKSFSLSVVITPLTVTSTSPLTSVAVGAAQNIALTATGGKTPYTWTLAKGSLPPGLTLSAAGVITGTPTTAGSYSFDVKVTDSQTPAVSATKTFAQTIVKKIDITPILNLLLFD